MKDKSQKDGENTMANYKAWFQCINDDCGMTYRLDEIIYRCEKCNNLLEVKHDIQALKSRSAASWMSLFDDRYKRNSFPYGSCIWGKKEWVLPEIDNENIISTYEGGTNCFWAGRYGRYIGVEDIWIKQCGNSHTGSFKDLGMTVLVSMVNQMISDGQDIRAVACASTGDTSAALAAYCAVAGIPSIVFLPHKKVSTAQLVQPISNGSIVLALDTDFDGCMQIVKEVTKNKTIYLANSMNSLRIEGQKTVSIELVQQFDWEVPDFIIIPGGNLGNVAALGNGFLMMLELGLINKLPTIILAQAAKANPLYLSYKKGFKEFKPVKAKKTLASAIQIGDPVSVNKAIKTLKQFDGIVEQATENELANAAALADRAGMFNCPHTGVALAVFQKMVEQKVIKSDNRVVIISTAHGLKFADFKVQYHEEKLAEVESKYANLPIKLSPDVDQVIDTLNQKMAAIKKDDSL